MIEKIFNTLLGFDYPYYCRYTREECKGEECDDLKWNDYEPHNCPDRYYPDISERYKNKTKKDTL